MPKKPQNEPNRSEKTIPRETFTNEANFLGSINNREQIYSQAKATPCFGQLEKQRNPIMNDYEVKTTSFDLREVREAEIERQTKDPLNKQQQERKLYFMDTPSKKQEMSQIGSGTYSAFKKPGIYFTYLKLFERTSRVSQTHRETS